MRLLFTFPMRVIGLLVVGLLLFAASPASAKKTKKTDDVLAIDLRGRKRAADDPVLRRYGKKAEYVAVWPKVAKKSSSSSVKPVKKPTKQAKPRPANDDDDDDVIAKRPAKAKKSKPADEEVVIIIED
jgi:hypothetical protein